MEKEKAGKVNHYNMNYVNEAYFKRDGVAHQSTMLTKRGGGGERKKNCSIR